MKLPWQDLQRFAATYLLDDLVALQQHGADAVLRERVAAMSDGQGSMLRAALDSVPS
jgi:hypothetical protein